MTIEQFREKYGAQALMLEKDCDYIINNDMEDLRTDPECKQRGFRTIENHELFLQFIDYTKAIGKYDKMFFLELPTGTGFYAYEEYGKQNIIKHISDRAESYRAKARELEKVIEDISESVDQNEENDDQFDW